MSKVSVVVPIYNAGKKLEKCIKSILNQTFRDIEIVLVNDGSTDNSLEICNNFRKKDKRIILINKNNEGCIVTRRKGVESSSSEYVMFVDADDWIDKNTIEILYNEAIKNNIDITVCNMYKVIGDRSLVKHKNESVYFKEDRIFTANEIKDKLVVAYFHGHPFPSNLVAKLYKRELLLTSGKYLDRISFLGEDLYYNLEMFLKANNVKVIDKPLYYYRVGGNTSKYMSYMFDDMVNGYKIQKEVIDEHYQDSKQSRYNGISIMLLNTFKTCLANMFESNLDKAEIKNKINGFIVNDCIQESLLNEGSRKYFEKDYLDAIASRNTEFLYNLGEKAYTRGKPRKLLINILSKVC
ncbi:glycosyltransferase family 2 protein [Bacillus sp. EB600]|uniref:glycosyltransferase family 2 protein n=1 Tax=Bacillus sp. EB600 TaxID=2806345 RepID=UPI00210BE8C0|nr:glycosyltransferase family 2 protein [Bacillus sp. EB600]MCQ6278881.1 glycosyltransferase family 2 protein [Bacillus sp. EB600]